LVLTDVKGSTKAIEAGRYKEVNMIGVSCIIAVQNVLGKIEFPFIFGGDGATLTIPPAFQDGVEKALSNARRISREEFKMDLRIAVIPVSRVRAAGGEVKVANGAQRQKEKSRASFRIPAGVDREHRLSEVRRIPAHDCRCVQG
jgi:hypothetical protein